jgi:hypothetical protein
MKISGFTFVRNAIKFDYPIVEAINSILPICDEVIVAVGKSEDDTLALIQGINSPKIKLIETIWDENLKTGGKVLAAETNKAFAAISPDADWAFYIQGDEVMPEEYLAEIKAALLQYKDDSRVEGFLVKYLHFFGSYNYVGDSRQWYRNEIRIIRNSKNITSYLDAQGFRTVDNKKLRVIALNACMHHYGWVREPFKLQQRNNANHKYWHGKEVATHEAPQEYDYSKVDSLAKFTGKQPEVMKQRIANMNWTFEPDVTIKKLSLKNKLLQWIEKQTGIRIAEYKNYVLLR